MTSFLQSFSQFSFDSSLVVLWASGIVFFLVILVFFFNTQKNVVKGFFFISICFVAIAATGYIVGKTLQLVNASPAKGPVHWHADFRIFNCGEEIDLIDPTGFSNRTGSPLVHEHGDKRIHIEGIPKTEDSVSLMNFFMSVGGYFNGDVLRIPTNMGEIEFKNGNKCGETDGVLQTFLWKTNNGVAKQEKLIADPVHYVISPEALVPPGDCVIFEFDEQKGRTEHICEQYEVAEMRGDITF